MARLGGNTPSASVASGSTTSAKPASIAQNTRSVRPPMRPIALRFVADATPVMSNETTSGMIVIRMALIQIAPIGANQSAACISAGLPDAAIAAPAARATMRAIRTAVLFFTVAVGGGWRRYGSEQPKTES